ncbi:CYTH domain-containing protein [Patescibacteria group bacterium]|nr:CYTH domain-containing protein [Patescibacteria group bacterium]
MESRNIEIELRSMFDEATYNRLNDFFAKNAEDLGEDNKDVFFFLIPGKLLKVVNNISKKTAKIVLKLSRIGHGSDFDETEIAISPIDYNKAVEMFTRLGFNDIQNTFQKRHNYLYKGVEMALKYSNTWGYHLELEIVVHNTSEKGRAEQKIREVADELDVHILSDKELAKFTKKVNADYKKGKYNK